MAAREEEVGGISKVIKVVSSALTLVGLVAGGVYALEARYAQRGETEKHLQLAEEKTAKTLDQFSRRQEVKFMQFRLDSLNAERYKIKNWLRQNPQDEDARGDLQKIEAEIGEVRGKIEKGLEPQ